METSNTLGEYLRARRERIRPEEVGLRVSGQRRTPGLRREEVAMLAGISTDYYLRLEQGRDRSPSTQVLDALADVLRLDADQTAYLHALTRPKSRRVARPRDRKVPQGTLLLLDALPMPAFVQDRYLTVLAANAMAEALSPALRPGVNRLAAAFLDPREAELYADWEQVTAAAVGQLRASMAADTDDPRLVALVGELSVKSERFRQMWARKDIARVSGGPARLHHPQVGDLELHREKLLVAGADGQMLVVYHAAPHTPSAERLALLGSLTAPPADSSDRTRRPSL
jgi:transcriptional regulator with XRE-family HTH domain